MKRKDCMRNCTVNKFIVIIGTLILIFGLFYDKLYFLGRLPGDIYIHKNNFHLYFPITTMIIFSIFFIILQKFFQ